MKNRIINGSKRLEEGKITECFCQNDWFDCGLVSKIRIGFIGNICDTLGNQGKLCRKCLEFNDLIPDIPDNHYKARASLALVAEGIILDSSGKKFSNQIRPL